MGSNVESGFYWDGYAAGMHGKSWTTLKYAPGTRAFHQAMEGHADGLKARYLQSHRTSTHHAHGGGYHAH